MNGLRLGKYGIHIYKKEKRKKKKKVCILVN